MKTFETKDFTLLNNIIYNIYTIKKFDEMREKFLEQMRMVLDFDGADYYLVSEDEERMVNPVTYNYEQIGELSVDDMDYSRSLLMGGKSMVFRETDIISDDIRAKTEYYIKILKPNNWHYCIQLVLCMDKKLIGKIAFYRNIGKDNFQYDDIFMLDMLKEHMAFRLSCEENRYDGYLTKITVSEAVTQYGLTKREHTILRLLMNGIENEKIANELEISINTLKKHILNIYRKLGIKNRVAMFKMIKEKE